MLKIFLISLFASVAFAISDQCNEAREACRTDEYYTMPENAEELDAYCESRIKMFQCLLEAQSQCGNNTDDSLYKESILVMTHICDKESELYNNLVVVLPCLKNEIVAKKHLKCHAMFADEPTIEKFEKMLNDSGITNVTRHHLCFSRYFFDACFIASNGAVCGTMARDVALDILEMQIDVRQNECTAKLKGKQTFLDIAPEMEILYLESEAEFKGIEGLRKE